MIGAQLQTRLDWEPGTFYRLGQGHGIVTNRQGPGPYTLGSKFQMVSMFEMWELCRDDKPVGHFFLSGMKVESKGSYIVTFMESKRGKAQDSQLLIRCPDFLLFDFPNCGAMVISTLCSPHMQSILEGQ